MSRIRSTAIASTCVAGLLAVGGVRALPSQSPSREPKQSESPEQKQQSLYDQGMDLVKSEEWSDARKIFERLEVEQPKNPDVLNMLAYTQRKTGDLDAAMGNYRKALAIKPKFPEAREYMAEAYLQAALREVETLKGYGGGGEEELAKLVDAFQEAAARAGDAAGAGTKGGSGKDAKKSSNW